MIDGLLFARSNNKIAFMGLAITALKAALLNSNLNTTINLHLTEECIENLRIKLQG